MELLYYSILYKSLSIQHIEVLEWRFPRELIMMNKKGLGSRLAEGGKYKAGVSGEIGRRSGMEDHIQAKESQVCLKDRSMQTPSASYSRFWAGIRAPYRYFL